MMIFTNSYVIQWGSKRSIVQFTLSDELHTLVVDNALILNSDETGVII